MHYPVCAASSRLLSLCDMWLVDCIQLTAFMFFFFRDKKEVASAFGKGPLIFTLK